VSVVEPLEEVGVARPAAAGADCQPTGQLGLGRGGERARLLVADVDPFDPVGAADRVDDRVEAVADDPVDALHAGLAKDVDQLLGQGRRAHRALLPVESVSGEPAARKRPAMFAPMCPSPMKPTVCMVLDRLRGAWPPVITASRRRGSG
jgi:hypothetical protein